MRHCLESLLEERESLALFLLSLQDMLQSIKSDFWSGVPDERAR